MNEKSKAITGTIDVSDGSVNLVDVTITDPAIVAAFRSAESEGRDLGEHLLQTLAIGLQVFDLKANNVGAEKIESAVNSASDTLSKSVNDATNRLREKITELAADDGAISTSVEKIIDSLKKDLESLTQDEDSPFRKKMMESLDKSQQAIRKDIQTQVESQRNQIAELLDPSKGTSPLQLLKTQLDDIKSTVAEIKTGIETSKATELEAARGTQKGGDYEDVAADLIQEIASLAGDDCEKTGNVAGQDGRNNKKGDAVVDVKFGHKFVTRLVMEAKNGKSLKTAKDWEVEAAGARRNRGAFGFIGLCKNIDDMPNGSRVLFIDPRTMVIAYDPEIGDPKEVVFLAYHIIRANSLGLVDDSDDVDFESLNHELETALSELKKFDALKREVTSIRNGADKVQVIADGLRSGIAAHLVAAQDLIRSSSNSLLEVDSAPETLEIDEA